MKFCFCIILRLIKIFLNTKINFSSPKNYDLVVIDNESRKEYETYLKNYNYFFLESRLENLKSIYITPRILLNTIIYYKGNIFTSYLVAIIKTIKPKIAFTFFDNSLKFSELAKILNKEIKFVAIQNASRWEIIVFDERYKKNIIKENYLKKLYIPYFLTHGKYDVHLFKKYKIKVKKFIIAGSLRLENFLDKIKDIKLKKIYDICLISDDITFGLNKKYHTNFLEDDFALLYKYIIRICLEENLKFVFAFKRLSNTSPLNNEKNFLKQTLTKKYYKFLINNSLVRTNKDIYSSYRAMSQSELTISTFSTMLGQRLAMNGKVLACNFTKAKFLNFPIKGICSTKKLSYKLFKKRVLYLLSMSYKNYNLKIKNKYYLINNYRTEKPSSVLKTTLDKLLQ